MTCGVISPKHAGVEAIGLDAMMSLPIVLGCELLGQVALREGRTSQPPSWLGVTWASSQPFLDSRLGLREFALTLPAHFAPKLKLS